jgi:putative lipoprotein
VAGAGYGFSAIGTEDIRVRIAFGAGAGILAGAAKEIFDLAGFGTPSWKDVTWDVIGVAVGLGISVSIDLAVRALSPQRAVAR